MDKECASVVICGEDFFKILSKKEKERRYSPVEEFREIHGIKVLQSSSVLEEAAKIVKRACIIFVDLTARISVETGWDLGFVYGIGRSRALIGVGRKKKRSDKINRTFMHKLRYQTFHSYIMTNAKIWSGLGLGISRCWKECGGDVEKVIDNLQVNIQELEKILTLKL